MIPPCYDSLAQGKASAVKRGAHRRPPPPRMQLGRRARRAHLPKRAMRRRSAPSSVHHGMVWCAVCGPRRGLPPDGLFFRAPRQANAEAQSEELQRQQLAGQKKEVAATASQENSAYKQLVRRLMIEREREREGGGGEGRSCIFTYTRGIPL